MGLFTGGDSDGPTLLEGGVKSLWGRGVADLADGSGWHEATSVRLEVLLGVLRASHGLAVPGSVDWASRIVEPVRTTGRTWVHWHTVVHAGAAWTTGTGVALIKSWTWTLHSANELLTLMIVVNDNFRLVTLRKTTYS